jgi:hypothetical protein
MSLPRPRSDGQESTGEPEAPDLLGAYLKAASLTAVFRQVAGYLAIGAGIFGVWSIGHTSIAVFADFLYHGVGWISVEQRDVYFVGLAGEALVTLAAIYFCYELIRLGERMVVPLYMVEQMRDLLGVTPPAESVRRTVVEATSVVADRLLPTRNGAAPPAAAAPVESPKGGGPVGQA